MIQTELFEEDQTIIAALQESVELDKLVHKCDPKFQPDTGKLVKSDMKKDVPPNIIIDIDHTLTQAQWRDGMIGGDWDTYHEAARHDRPIPEMIALASALTETWTVTAITSRPEKWRLLTMEWFLRHRVRVDKLLMRANDDLSPSAILKIKMAKEYFGEPLSDHVAFIIDDNEAICAAFAAEGIPSLQIYSRIIK